MLKTKARRPKESAAASERRFTEEVLRISAAARAGKLGERARASQFEGSRRDVCLAINEMLDAMSTPLRAAAECLRKFAAGEMADKIVENYPGDLHEIQVSTNTLIDSVMVRNADLKMLIEAAREGKLDVRADASRHAGFNSNLISALNEIFDDLSSPIREASSVLQLSAGQDLTARVTGEYKGAFLVLKNDLNNTLETLQYALAQIAETTGGLATSAEELSGISQQMAGNAEETAIQSSVVSAASEQVSQNLSVVATGAEEMLSSIREIAKSANEAARVARSAVGVAESTNHTIAKLGESSAEIGNVVKVITSIAQQTNLLALNATIEAARAGEAGKGFAVVANEVKELAKQTAKATEDIGQRIDAIQGDSKRSVQAIAEISGVINQINDISHVIASAVEEQTATTNEMGRNIGEAAKCAGEISGNISSVATAAGNTTSGASNTQQAARALSEMATRLQTLVGAFKV
jgi:methyl-accepting chemotaxis protein